MADHTPALFDRVFAVTIAFLLPGLIVLFGIATVYAPVATWFEGAQNGPTITGFVFVLMAALALNVIVTCLRWTLFEKLACRWTRPASPDGARRTRTTWVPPAPPYDESRRYEKREVLSEIKLDFYYHYLAYANAAVALPTAVVIWQFGTPMIWQIRLGVGIGTLLVIAALGAAACDAIQRYDRSASEVLGMKQGVAGAAVAPGPPTASAVAVEAMAGEEAQAVAPASPPL